MGKDKTYYLVNPLVHGSIKFNCKADSPDKAALTLYNKLAEHIAGTTNNFAFTIQQVGKNDVIGGGSKSKYHSYSVSETNTKGEVSTVLHNIECDVKSLQQNVNSVLKAHNTEQKGGNRKQNGGLMVMVDTVLGPMPLDITTLNYYDPLFPLVYDPVAFAPLLYHINYFYTYGTTSLTCPYWITTYINNVLYPYFNIFPTVPVVQLV